MFQLRIDLTKKAAAGSSYRQGSARAVAHICLLLITQLFAPPSAAARDLGTIKSRSSTPHEEDMFYGNRGYLYYNAAVPEKIKKVEPTLRSLRKRTRRLRQKTAPVQPERPYYRQPEIQRPAQTEPAPYVETFEPELTEERRQIMLKNEQIETLRAKLERALRQLAAATQRIMQFQKDSSAVSTKITQTYQVKEGDSLWSIAAKKEIYGNPKKWLLLYHANRDQIYDPNLIFTDMILLVPHIDEYRRQ